MDKKLFHGDVNYNFEDLSNCYIEIFTNCTIFEDKKNCLQMNVIVDSSAILRKRSLLKIVCSLLEQWMVDQLPARRAKGKTVYHSSIIENRQIAGIITKYVNVIEKNLTSQ